MPLKTSDKITCRFCDYSVLRWKTAKSGKRINGIVSLTRHVENAHEDEYYKIIAYAQNNPHTIREEQTI